jgi:uncharacterized membrane protein YgcG
VEQFKVAAVEAMRYPIVSGMDGEALMVRRKEVLYAFIFENPDCAQVIEDYTRYVGDYESMYAQCLAVHMKLVTEGKGTPGRGHGDHQGRGRDRGNAFGNGQRGGGRPGGAWPRAS